MFSIDGCSKVNSEFKKKVTVVRFKIMLCNIKLLFYKCRVFYAMKNTYYSIERGSYHRHSQPSVSSAVVWGMMTTSLPVLASPLFHRMTAMSLCVLAASLIILTALAASACLTKH